MSRLTRRLTLLALIIAAGPAAAQGFYYRSGGVVVGRVGPRGAFAFGAGGFAGGYYFNPYGVTTIRQVTVFYTPPPYVPPPIVITPPPVIVNVGGNDNPPRRDPEPPPLVVEPALPGRRAGVFRPLAPDNRARAARPLAPDNEPGEDNPRKPEVRAADPPADRRVLEEAGRLAEAGRTAFALKEYGRATEHFGRAAALAPRDGVARFLLGQAYFALGKYREAVEAIQSGLLLLPDWPEAHFNPRDLYGAAPTDFPDHLLRLEQARTRHPDDPFLLFLQGYELWLDSRRDEARLILQRAKRNGAPAAAVEPFLQPVPGGRVL